MIASKKSIAKAQTAKAKKDNPKPKNKVRVYVPEKRYTSFNIFTKYGENLTVKSDRPMTLYEAADHFGALSISGND